MNLISFIHLPFPKIHYSLSPPSLLVVTESNLEVSMPNTEQNGAIDF